VHSPIVTTLTENPMLTFFQGVSHVSRVDETQSLDLWIHKDGRSAEVRRTFLGDTIESNRFYCR